MVISSGDVSSGIVISNNSMFVYSGGVANDVAVSGEGEIRHMLISSGGVANETEVNSGGYVNIYDGGAANETTLSGGYYWNESAVMNVSSGGEANSTTVNSRGFLYISSGGTANETTVNSYGSMYVDNGGTASSTTVNSGGSMSVFSSGTANSTTVNSGGYMRVSSGGTALAITENGGYVTISDGATVTFVANVLSELQLSWAATLHSGTTANSTTVYSGGSMYVSSGGIANSTTVNSSGRMYVSSGVANSTTVNSGGHMFVFSGGVANSTTVNSGGKMNISSGGSALAITENGGYVLIAPGANAIFVANSFSDLVLSNTSASLHSGTTANATTLNSGGSMTVYSGGTANATTANNCGKMFVLSGGVANETTLNSGGSMHVYSDGVASETTVNANAEMLVYSGGKVTGVITFDADAAISMDAGSILDFDISAVAPASPAQLNNWSLTKGAPDCTVTVSAAQAKGAYALAGGASSFDSTVTIMTVAGTELGAINVGGELIYGDYTYSLDLASEALTLTIAGSTPPTPTVGAKGDLNGDGRADIVMTITEVGHGAEGATGAWMIQSDQTAAWGDLSQRNEGWEIFGKGFTTAGKTTADVYVRSSDNVIGAWVTDGSGKVASWAGIEDFDESTQVLGLGDFNGDGQSDLLLRNTNGAVGCYFTSGDKLGWNYFQSLGEEWHVAAVGDFNGDGRDDVVLVHDAGFAGSWLTQSDYTMAWADLDTVKEGFSIVGAGDFNGDGTDDVLLQTGNYYGAWIVQNGNASAWMGLGEFGGTVEEIADFDADGVDDLRLRTDAGDLGVQLVKGEASLEWHYYGSVGSEWSTSLAAL